MSSILKGLNEQQKLAASTVDGSILIIAGAGSGKTKTLTHRVAYMIKESRIRPQNILTVTFTNKAAQEMKERITSILETTDRRLLPVIGTFHSICVRILRYEIEKLGYKSSFNIIDDQDQQAMIKKIMKEFEMSTDQFNPRAILGAISSSKNNMLDGQAFSDQANGYYEETVAKIYRKYEDQLKQNNTLDFDDIINFTVKIFKDFPEVLEKYQDRFKYIMVDEYQDTNKGQYLLINFLAKKHRNLCVVGDDWQCLPPGTKIQQEKKKTNIESISENENVVSCAGGSRESCVQKIDKIKKTNFSGDLIEIQTKLGKKIRVTPNHILFSKLSLKPDIFYVYLMYKKEMGYRIGTAKGIRVAKSNYVSYGLNIRANQERADKMWVLQVCKDRNEAAFWEVYYSSYYGVPEIVFRTSGRQMRMEQKYIDRLYEKINTTERAMRIFKDFDLDFAYPHHIPSSTIRNETRRITINFTMFSDNRKLIPGDWGMHQISMNSNDKKTRMILQENGFSTRKGKFGDWRMILSKKNYSELEKSLKILKKILPEAEVIKKASLSSDRKKFYFMPASHIRKTMLLPVLLQGKIVEDEIIAIKKIKYSGPVYDLSVSNTHNYAANDIIVHNSIYKFRGADIRNILCFEGDYPDSKIIRLEQNYRSSQVILDAAYGVISKNINRKDKKLWTEQKDGHLITSYEADDEHDEADFIAKEIANIIRSKNDQTTRNNSQTNSKLQIQNSKQGTTQIKYSDFVVMYRTNAQSRMLEEVFLRRSIPYRIIGGLKFYQRKEIKDVVAYVRFLYNPNDIISLERIINEPKRGIGSATVSKWIEFTREVGLDFVSSGMKISTQNSSLNAGKIDAIRKFCEFSQRMSDVSTRIPISDLIEKIFKESGYEQSLLSDGTEGEVRWENVKELISVAKKYNDEQYSEVEDKIGSFLEEVSLASDTDSIDQKTDSVHMMTLHSSKGLEFPYIFIVGLEEGILPHSRSLLSYEEMEEERRLMYVGLTRAKEKIYLLFTRQRMLFGSTQVNPPSRFLEDIPEELKIQSEKTKANNKLFNPDFKNFSLPEDNKLKSNKLALRDGDRVRHEEFGDGVVISVVEDLMVIAFKKVGIKRISIEYAKMEKI